MFPKSSYFSHNPDKLREEMEQLNLSPFSKSAKTDPSTLHKQICNWADELADVIFELEESSGFVDDSLLQSLRDVAKSMEDLLDSFRDETRSADSPHRSSGIR